ncbi:MAG: hypothetical protein Q9224_000090 [Gallowayella concinna]
MSCPQDAWDGESSVFDAEEKQVLFAALDSFRQYRKVAHLNVTHRRRQNFYALPSTEWQLLSTPPFNFLSTLDQIDDAIDGNADIAREILKTGLESFGLESESPENPSDWHNTAKASDLDKARCTIRQFYRDWSAEGEGERRASYEPVLHEIAIAFAALGDKGAVRILVPGAGLGRLLFEICREGYSVEGNEISYHQLLASNWVLNHAERAKHFDLFPFVSDFSNVVSRADQLKMVKVPDVHAGTALTDGDVGNGESVPSRMIMTAGEFTEVYNVDSKKDAFDAVATVYFIDTASNLIRYIQTVYNCLKLG